MSAWKTIKHVAKAVSLGKENKEKNAGHRLSIGHSDQIKSHVDKRLSLPSLNIGETGSSGPGQIRRLSTIKKRKSKGPDFFKKVLIIIKTSYQ